jgi:hypothetical protein
MAGTNREMQGLGNVEWSYDGSVSLPFAHFHIWLALLR